MSNINHPLRTARGFLKTREPEAPIMEVAAERMKAYVPEQQKALSSRGQRAEENA